MPLFFATRFNSFLVNSTFEFIFYSTQRQKKKKRKLIILIIKVYIQ